MSLTQRMRQSPHQSDSMQLGISAEFPVLKAAHDSGDRALISWIGDSTVANAGSLLEQNSTAWYLRKYLAYTGLEGVIGGASEAATRALH
jgi:hypothetical protein